MTSKGKTAAPKAVVKPVVAAKPAGRLRAGAPKAPRSLRNDFREIRCAHRRAADRGPIHEHVVAADGVPAVHRFLPLSLRFDHRIVTGGEAARFLAATIADLQNA
ncbi:hypothetical protein OKW35_000122 [Paraburkholderia sp. MM5477-R1]